MTLEEKRFVDEGRILGFYAQETLAVCPRCCGPALVRSPTRYALPFAPEGARVHCLRCSYVREQGDTVWYGGVVGHAHRPCPYCSGRRWLRAVEHRAALSDGLPPTARVDCPGCGRTATLPLKWYRDAFSGEAVDPTFGLPLWLQEPCCGHALWAYNGGHLGVLRSYVAATHRERRPNAKWSMIGRLPKWMTAAKNREEVVRCAGRLTERLLEAGLPSSQKCS